MLIEMGEELNLRRIYEISEAPHDSNVLIIKEETCSNGNLNTVIDCRGNNMNYFKEHEIWNIITQLVMGLKSLHSMNIYSKLKLESIYITKSGILKIGDVLDACLYLHANK